MSELALVETRIAESHEFVVPWTGELVDLTEPGQVARALEGVRDAKRVLDEARALLEGALVLEAQRQGTKTLNIHAYGLQVVITGGTRTEWDAERLQQLLREAGMPEPTIAEIVVEIVSWKVDARRAQRAASMNPAYQAPVDASRIDSPAPWHATIKRPAR